MESNTDAVGMEPSEEDPEHILFIPIRILHRQPSCFRVRLLTSLVSSLLVRGLVASIALAIRLREPSGVSPALMGVLVPPAPDPQPGYSSGSGAQQRTHGPLQH